MEFPEIKWQLEEIQARYRLEPSLRDLYVEGESDLNIFRWFLYKQGKKHIYVYPIDIVQIPDDLFRRTNLSKHSNRNKVILLSEELSRYFNEQRIEARCIVDVDYDRYLDRLRNNYILEYTDYTSVEMYLFNEAYMRKFTTLVLGNFSVSVNKLLRNFKDILQKIFVIRLANEKLNWQMKWVDVKRYITLDHEVLKFDESGFLKAYLLQNGRFRDVMEFKTAMRNLSKILHKDPRHNINGHDFIYLLFLISKKFRPHRAGFQNIKTFEGVFYGCIELDFLKDEALFGKLVAL